MQYAITIKLFSFHKNRKKNNFEQENNVISGETNSWEVSRSRLVKQSCALAKATREKL